MMPDTINLHRRKSVPRLNGKGLWLAGLLACTGPMAQSAETKQPERLLHRADSLSIFYAEGLYRDPSLADSFSTVQSYLKRAFIKPARFDSLETAWETALNILERIPDCTEDFTETTAFLVRQMEKICAEQTVQARLSVWKLLYDKGCWSLNTYRTALRKTGMTETTDTDDIPAEAGYRAAVYLALAETYRSTQPDTAHFYATQALACIEPALASAKQPKAATREGEKTEIPNLGKTKEICLLLLNSLEAPFLSVDGLNVYMPERPLLWSVCAKNISSLPYRIFQVPAEDRMNFLSGMFPFDRYAENRNAIQEGVWQLEDFPQDYREHRAEVSLPSLPAGTYLLTVGNRIFLPFQVSELALIDFGPAGFTVRRTTGEALAGVSVDIFTAEYDYKTHLNRFERLGNTYRSRTDGFVDWGEPDPQGEDKRDGLNRFFLFRYGTDSLIRTFVRPPFPIRNDAAAQPAENDTLAGVQIFFDLPVYKAGDSVRFKGVSWGRRAGSGTPFFLAGRRLILSPSAPNPLGSRAARQAPDETPGSLYVETDSLGGFTGGFRLPDAATAGLWQLWIQLAAPHPATRKRTANVEGFDESPSGRIYLALGHSPYFRVEAYRPPQFEIRLENRDSAVWGQAVSLDGQALRNSDVRIDIDFEDGVWRPTYLKTEKHWQASLTTDANGCFLLPTALFAHLEDEVAENMENSDRLEGHYRLSCSVADLSGEMQTASIWLPSRHRKLRADLQIPQTRSAMPMTDAYTPEDNVAGSVAETTADTFKIFILNPMGERRAADYRLTFYGLTDTLPDRAFERRFPEPDRYPIPLDTFLRDFPNEPYFTRETRQASEKRRAVFTCNGLDTVFTAELPDGRYAYKIWITHPWVAERIDSCEGFFDLGRQPRVPTLYARLAADSMCLDWVVPEKPRFTDSSVCVYYSIENRHGKTVQGYLPLKPAHPSDSDAADRVCSGFNFSDTGFPAEDDLNILLAYVCGGRLFQQSFYRNGRTSEIPLEITIDRLPDSARVHTSDTLTLHVGRSGRGSADIPLTLALYDDALHAFAPENWFDGLPPRLVPPVTPIPFNRHFYGYDPMWFTQKAAYTSPDAYRYDRILRGGKRPMALGMRMVKATDANDSEAAADKAATGTDARLPMLRGGEPASVYFFPTLRSDADGYLRLPFDLPASPGRYRWTIAAYDRNLQAAYATRTIQTIRDYRLSWQPPRFLYLGDSVRFSAKANRLDASAPQTATLIWEIADQRFTDTLNWATGETDRRLTSPTVYCPRDSGTLTVRLCLSVATTTASVTENAIGNLPDVSVPIGDALTAEIPVLSDRIYLREHIPFYIRPGEQTVLTLPKKLIDAIKKSAAIDTVFHWTANPAQRIELLCQELSLDSADHAYNALLHYLKTRLLHGDGTDRTAAAYKRLCRFLTPDNGFCWLQGQPTDPFLSLVIAEALAANVLDNIDVRRLLQRDLLPFIERSQNNTAANKDGRTAADSLPSSDRLRFLFAATAVYGPNADYHITACARDLQSFSENVGRYPIRTGVYGLCALHLHGDTALSGQVWRHYRRIANYNDETGLSWKQNDMGLNQGERLKTASFIYRLLRHRNDWTEAAAVNRWITRQNRTTDLLSPATNVRPMDVLTLAYNERLFPLPAWSDKTPATWRLQGRKLTIDWHLATIQTRATATSVSTAVPDSAATLFGTYGALTFGYTQSLETVTASAPASDLRIDLLIPERLSQGSSPILQLRIESKRPASYVRIRFGRPGGSEYGTTRAGFVYKNGLSFYEDIQATGTDLLIPFLPAGRYLLSYPLNAQNIGRFALPPATIETLLDTSDSFSAHSDARSIRIQTE